MFFAVVLFGFEDEFVRMSLTKRSKRLGKLTSQNSLPRRFFRLRTFEEALCVAPS
jgi:hypothetical protein